MMNSWMHSERMRGLSEIIIGRALRDWAFIESRRKLYNKIIANELRDRGKEIPSFYV